MRASVVCSYMCADKTWVVCVLKNIPRYTQMCIITPYIEDIRGIYVCSLHSFVWRFVIKFYMVCVYYTDVCTSHTYEV